MGYCTPDATRHKPILSDYLANRNMMPAPLLPMVHVKPALLISDRSAMIAVRNNATYPGGATLTPLTIVRGRDTWANFTARLHASHVLIVNDWGNVPVTVGAPHHAPYGRPRLRSGRVADANTGLLARNIAVALGGRAVVACDADEVDVNKAVGWGYGYLEAIFDGRPQLILEIHGHNVAAIGRTIELTTHGDVERAWRLAQSLEARVSPLGLRVAVVGRDELVFAATSCETLRHARELGIEAYHIEVPAPVRWRRGATRRHLPRLGVAVARALAESASTLLAAHA